MIRNRPMLLAALLFLSLGACQNPRVNTVEAAPPSETLYQKVIFSNQLERKVKIQNVKKDVKDGFLRVQVDLRNNTSRKETFEYVYEWFDESGMQIAPTTAIWTQATIFPGETRSFPITAASKAATDFRFKVKSK